MKDIMEEVMEEEEVTLLLLLQEAMEPMEHQAQATLLQHKRLTLPMLSRFMTPKKMFVKPSKSWLKPVEATEVAPRKS
jgi:hypothetical protein